MANKFILGGGISGLIYAFYNQDYCIISQNLGGKLTHEYLSSTILLHNTLETRRLLTDLSIDIKPSTHLVRCFYDGKLIEKVPIIIHQILAKKKLTPWYSLSLFNINGPISNDSLFTTASIPILRVSLSYLIKALSKEIQWIEDKVLMITANKILTEKGKRYEYTDLISTIPAPKFWKLYQKSKELQYLPVTFVYSDTNPLPTESVPWHLIYFLDDDVKYTRVNKNPGTDNYLYEFTGKITIDELKKLYPSLNVKDYYLDPYAIVITDLNNIPPPNIRFLGRFAVWDYRYRIENVIREALARYDFISIWNFQKAFNANFFDFNIKDIELQQRLTKDFVLLATDELHELLECINWKVASYQETSVDRSRLLEEWIDIFKYWLGIGNIWGFSPEEFFNEFWRKSKVVEQRYTSGVIRRIQNSLIAGKRKE